MNNTDTYQINSYFAALNAIKPSSLNSLLNKLAGGELVSTGKNCFWSQVADTNLLALVHYDDKNRKIVTQLDRIDSGYSDTDKDIGQHDIITYGGRVKTDNKTKKKTIKPMSIEKKKNVRSRSRSRSSSRSRSKSKSRSRSRSRDQYKTSTSIKKDKPSTSKSKKQNDEYYRTKTSRDENKKKSRKILSPDEYA
jgi:hypothetical protein